MPLGVEEAARQAPPSVRKALAAIADIPAGQLWLMDELAHAIGMSMGSLRNMSRHAELQPYRALVPLDGTRKVVFGGLADIQTVKERNGLS